jgi:hypothetical protein
MDTSNEKTGDEKMITKPEQDLEALKWKYIGKHSGKHLVTRKDVKGITIVKHLTEKEFTTKYPELSGNDNKKEEKSTKDEEEMSIFMDKEPTVRDMEQKYGSEKKIEVTDEDFSAPSEFSKLEKDPGQVPRVAPCYRCLVDVKLPVPLFNCDCPKEKKEAVILSFGDVPVCKECKKKCTPIGAKCPTCQYYVAAPNEVFDAGMVNFTLPPILSSLTEKAILVARDQHEMPCPSQTNPDISKDLAINEYVLNKLPLTEELKKSIQEDLFKEQIEKERLEKRKSGMNKQLKLKKLERAESRSFTDSKVRPGVKGSQFQLS